MQRKGLTRVGAVTREGRRGGLQSPGYGLRMSGAIHLRRTMGTTLVVPKKFGLIPHSSVTTGPGLTHPTPSRPDFLHNGPSPTLSTGLRNLYTVGRGGSRRITQSSFRGSTEVLHVGWGVTLSEGRGPGT